MTEVLRLASPLPAVIDSAASLAAAVQELATASGPLGVDAERAGSYRYSQKAYLVQIYRRGAPVLLLDPLGMEDFSGLAALLAADQWVMQAAHNDLECLAGLGLRPTELFDTEIAAQLLGLEKVGLGSLVETQLGYSMRKSHGQADWSRRPLRPSWLEYAALDVTVLPDLQDELGEHLRDSGKTLWAEQEFAHQLRERPVPDPAQRWRRTAGAGKLRTDAQRGALRQLWVLRDDLARSRDLAWHRIVRDQVLVEMARRLPASADQLSGIAGVPRPLLRNAQQWVAAVARGVEHPEPVLERRDGPPARNLRAWEQRDPAAAARWVGLRSRLADRAEDLHVWTQILLAPDIVAALAWEPPADPVARLGELGARPWQIEHTIDLTQ